jgi:hypothetical protein
MYLRRAAAALALIGLIVLLAPLLFAVAKAAAAGNAVSDRGQQADALLEAYRAYDPPPLQMPLIDWEGDFIACGYRSETLLGADNRTLSGSETGWTPFDGFLDLFVWRHRHWQERVDGQRIDLLGARTSAFSSEFLRICMRQSLAAPLCAWRVRSILAAAHLDGNDNAGRIDESRQSRTICTYLDGLAARKGQPLGVRTRQ